MFLRLEADGHTPTIESYSGLFMTIRHEKKQRDAKKKLVELHNEFKAKGMRPWIICPADVSRPT